MLAVFALRLACGMAAALLLLSPAQVNPRFYRVQFLVILALSAGAGAVLGRAAGIWLWVALGTAMVLAFLASASWSLEGAPGGRALIGLTALSLVAALVLVAFRADGRPPVTLPEAETAGRAEPSRQSPGWQLAGELSSAALLGSAITAMLMGHSYLVAPAMSLTPLLRLIAALATAAVLRMAVAGVGLLSLSATHSLFNLNDVTALWLPVRWGLGFVAPLVLAWMAWQTARIRSTQSATGILYVVVIFCFLGELTGQLLWSSTGFFL